MQRLLLFTILTGITCSVPGNTRAQITFAKPGTTWVYEQMTSHSWPYQLKPYYVMVEDTVTFEGKLCSRINLGSWIPDYESEYAYLYEQNDSVFYYNAFSGKFQLLYDFNAITNDEVYFDDLYPLNYSGTMYIDSVGYLSMNGDSLNVWHHHNLPYINIGTLYMEKVGSNFFIVPLFDLADPGLVNKIRCFDDGENFYQFVPYPCDTVIMGTVSTDDIRITAVSAQLFPNPVVQTLSVSLESSHTALMHLHSPQGILIASYALNDHTTRIDMSGIPAGLYFVTIVIGGHRVQVEKILRI